MKEQDVF